MSVTPITNHEDIAVSRLVSQFKGKLKFEALLRVLAARWQGLENAYAQVLQNRWLHNATSSQLEGIGAILGLPRVGGTADISYRIQLYARIEAMRSSGTPEEYMSVFLVLLPTADPGVTEHPPAAFTIRLGSMPLTTLEVASYWRLARQMKPSGVRMTFEYRTTPEDETFSFLDDNGLGFGDSGNPATGGTFAGAL